MTIGQYLDDLQKLPEYKNDKGAALKDTMLNITQVWSNYACKGYALHAMREAGLEPEQISEVLRQMSYAFNDKTVDEMEQFYDRY